MENILQRIYNNETPNVSDIEKLLSLKDKKDLTRLFMFADVVRCKHVGDGVFFRGIIEFSNRCGASCLYCGINKNNTVLKRYKMSEEEILQTAAFISANKIKTVVLQSGEDRSFDVNLLGRIIARIKKELNMAVTLSVGERSFEEYKFWKECGADRYLLKMETTDEILYKNLHPEMSFRKRLKCLEDLKRLNYQTGSGIITGFKGQSVEGLAKDIMFFCKENFDMISIGPFVSDDKNSCLSGFDAEERTELALKAIAVTRIITRDAHMPSTTALSVIDKNEDLRFNALKCGANVIMPNFTPLEYKKLYTIYPKEVKSFSKDVLTNIEKNLLSLGRYADYGYGHSLKRCK